MTRLEKVYSLNFKKLNKFKKSKTENTLKPPSPTLPPKVKGA
jgi:hypothetical protein